MKSSGIDLHSNNSVVVSDEMDKAGDAGATSG
jgi:hypothetical protein